MDIQLKDSNSTVSFNLDTLYIFKKKKSVLCLPSTKETKYNVLLLLLL